MAPQIAPKFIPAISQSVDTETSGHLRQLYTASNDHDQAIVTLKSQVDELSANAAKTAATAVATAAALGGASGSLTIPPLTANGSYGTLTISNGQIVSVVYPT